MTDELKPARVRRRPGDPEPTEKMREYLEVIYYLSARNEPVIAARLADWMHVTAPTVTNIVAKMEQRGYITRDSHNLITLTEDGFALAEAMVRRHRILERFLVDVMGLPWHQIHDEAVRLEHALSPTMEARIESLVGSSLTCPHGNPIPGNLASYPGTIQLSQAHPGHAFTIMRIAEEAEEQIDLIRFLQSNDLTPGSRLDVLDQSPAYGVTLRRGDQTITLTPQMALALWGEYS